jgi:hypothetical protein
MAKVTLEMATAHGPQITLPPASWDLQVEADRANPDYWFRGKKYNFDQFLALRRSEKIGEKLTPQGKQAWFDRCQRALDELARIYAEARPDVAVIFGNDQVEIGAAMRLVDYVPCYRSEAGTANAMGFVHWTP